MKKILVLLLSVMLSVVTYGQSKGLSAQSWSQYTTDADELRGTQASLKHFVEIPDEGVVVLDDKLNMFGFVSFNGIFDYKPYQYDFNVTTGIFGMYDEAGKLVGKREIMLSVHDDATSASADSRITVLKNSGIGEVASWIRNSKGSVRIIIPRYGKLDFDITVPTFLSQKPLKSKQTKSKGTVQRKNTKKSVRK